MSQFTDYIEKYRLKCDLKTDTAIAERLGISRQNFNRAKKKGLLPDRQCELIARRIGIEPIFILAAREAHKEEVSGKPGPWCDGLQKISKTAASFMLLILLAFPAFENPEGSGVTHDDSVRNYRKLLEPLSRLALSAIHLTILQLVTCYRLFSFPSRWEAQELYTGP